MAPSVRNEELAAVTVPYRLSNAPLSFERRSADRVLARAVVSGDGLALTRHNHRHHLILELAGFYRGRCPLVREGSVPVLVLPRYAEPPGKAVGVLAHDEPGRVFPERRFFRRYEIAELHLSEQLQLSSQCLGPLEHRHVQDEAPVGLGYLYCRIGKGFHAADDHGIHVTAEIMLAPFTMAAPAEMQATVLV